MTRCLPFAVLLVFLAAPAYSQHPHSPWCDHRPPGVDPGVEEGAAAADAESVDDAEDAEPEDWDVNDPPLAEVAGTRTVEIDVDEGTWMSLDVSPDGEHIVFDLLGDLYLLPIAGGDARALTSGLAWDMQPRFSPDGSEIAFTSDRGGGDNLWVIPAAGDPETMPEPRQVTDESFRLLNNPAWSPDGRFLAARKHFTSRRSLGAGEIWLYHRSGEGGSGLQLNERPNEQKDLGEPAFSPDGRYVYFSRDTTPGGVFEYNKDPSRGIYDIQRLDLRTGEIETLVSGPGGAVRPTPSPDGRKLAFVRRLGYATTLYLKDLESGAERPLYAGLDRDLQETWAVHGVYPNFAWTPQSDALVFWAGGGLHRLEIATGRLVGIPFRVRQDHTVLKAARFAEDPAPETFHTRALRWVRVSPDGSRVVFQALGKLWVRHLDNAVDGAVDVAEAGPARRLTTQEEHDELYPSWSRDGRWIVYSTWDDEELGTIRRIGVGVDGDGAAAAVLTSEPGHYVEPVLSPDGSTLVYRKVGGGFLTAPLYSRETGLYALRLAPPAPGEDAPRPRLLSESGRDPHFAAGSERVYFLEPEPEPEPETEDRRVLRSAELDPGYEGDEVLTHARSEAATRFRVSPDGRWLAYTERYRAHVVPFTEAAKALEVGPEVTGLPSATVSRDAGDHLHWSGDSSKLRWTVGPELFAADLEVAFAHLESGEDAGEEGAGEDDGEGEADPAPAGLPGLDLGFDVDHDAPEGVKALVGGRVVTMAGTEAESVIEDGVVLVDGARIAAVGPRGEVEIPADAEIVDVAGHTVIPGIVDVHWHGAQGTAGIVPQRNWMLDATLAFGVTTVHDPSSDTHTFFAAAELQRAGLRVAPRLFSTGRILYGAAGDFKAIVDSVDDARAHLRRLKAMGAFSVKSYNQPRRDQRQQVLQAAHELEMLVMPEGGSLFMHNMTQVVDGHTGIEHAVPLAELYADVDQLWSATEVAYTPTLVVAYGGIWGENYWYAETDVWNHPRLLDFVPREFVDPLARRPFQAPLHEYNHVATARQAHELAVLGVDVNVGAHGQREGLGAHWEIWMLEQGGFTPYEALRAATWNGALYLGMEEHLGSLEAGKLADLAVIEGDPLADLRTSEKVAYSVVGGRIYDARTMREMGSDESPVPFWFTLDDEPLVAAAGAD